MEDFVPKTPESKALLILDDYEGSNNYILNLKHKKENSLSYLQDLSRIISIIITQRNQKLQKNGLS
jgi:hypothetical protein